MRYIIGIDLGTTNSCVAYVDSEQDSLTVQQFRIPQLIASGYVEQMNTLPSFCYLLQEGQWAKGSLDLPWKKEPDFFVGHMAQVEGAKVPMQLVQSAKSWLCHSAANRRDAILPFEAPIGSQRISPVEASCRYLGHIKEAWNHIIAKGKPELEFEQQEVVLTVPASFDEIARGLTAEAAKKAGLTHLTLLEEPQAAFYSWIAQHEALWKQSLPIGSTILVCDVGGGTTDFSLIEVSGQEKAPKLQRMAVGDHLLLGGDNVDTAIAHKVEGRLFKKEPTAIEWMQLKAQSRLAKETLLDSSSKKEIYTIVIQGKGSSVVAGSLSTTISKNEIEEFLLNGFFGVYEWEEAIALKKGSGMRSVGLPYEDEPSITKHLASFLKKSSGSDSEPKKPDFVLFNGGTMKPQIFQDAIIKSLEKWFPEKSPKILPSYHLDLAVGRGATYYGKVRRGLGVRIGGGAARGYYLGLKVKDSSGSELHKALTLLPRGAEEGAYYEPEHTFMLLPNTPVEFQLYSSHVRLEDKSGDLVDIDLEEIHPLPPIRTVLRFGKKLSASVEPIPVHLTIRLNAIGTLELALKSQKTEHLWALEFQIRSVSGQENSLESIGKARHDETFDKKDLEQAFEVIDLTFEKEATVKASQLMERLETALEMPRKDWSPSILRALWEPLLKNASNRLASEDYNVRWWNLAGFCLRPGFGFPLDDFRVKDLWKIILSDFKSKVTGNVQIQKLICFRRIAAGLNKGQQLQIAHELLPQILPKKNSKIEIKNKSDVYSYSEKIRTLASLELIDIPLKQRIGLALVEKICSFPASAIAADYWALARIGARALFHGSIANVIPKEICVVWLDKLLAPKGLDEKLLSFVVLQLARKTDAREVNLPTATMDAILFRFSSLENYSSFSKQLLEGAKISQEFQEEIFGEKLPVGLTLEGEY